MGDRIETGCIQFGDDWPGIFIRGDNALMGFVPALRAALMDAPDPWGLRKAELESLLKLLESCRADRAKPRVIPAPKDATP